MAKIRIILESNEGTVLRDYTAVGDINLFNRVSGEAIKGSIDGYKLEEKDPRANKNVEVIKELADKARKLDIQEKEGLTAPIKVDPPTKVPQSQFSFNLEDKLKEKFGQVEPAKKEYLNTLQEGKKAVVGFKCPKCGVIHFGFHEIGDIVKCHYCKDDMLVPEGLIFTKYQCPYCETQAYLYIQKDITDTVSCKGCRVPVDVVYIEKLGEYRSANLAK